MTCLSLPIGYPIEAWLVLSHLRSHPPRPAATIRHIPLAPRVQAPAERTPVEAMEDEPERWDGLS